jgi:MFS superfamily sulfate permease-like transporter
VVLPNFGSKKLGIIVSFFSFPFPLVGFAVGLCIFAKQTEDFFGTYKEKKFLNFI